MIGGLQLCGRRLITEDSLDLFAGQMAAPSELASEARKSAAGSLHYIGGAGLRRPHVALRRWPISLRIPPDATVVDSWSLASQSVGLTCAGVLSFKDRSHLVTCQVALRFQFLRNCKNCGAMTPHEFFCPLLQHSQMPLDLAAQGGIGASCRQGIVD